jgi:hypothetical protein
MKGSGTVSLICKESRANPSITNGDSETDEDNVPGTLQQSAYQLCRACYQPKRSRGGGIRTHDLFVPNEARYQAAPHPA